MNKKLQVVFCTEGVFPHLVGGIQRHSRLLIEQLAQREGLEIIVLHPHTGVRVFSDPRIREIEIAPLPGQRQYLLELYDYSRRIFEALKAFPEALIYAQGLTVWHGAGALRRRLIFNPHGLEQFQTLTLREYLWLTPYRWIFRHIFRRSAAVVSLGGKLTDIVARQLGGRKERIAVLANGVPMPGPFRYAPAEQPPLRVLFFSRFVFNKGIDVLLDAIALLNAEGKGALFQFTLAGKGPLFDEYSQSRNYGNVVFPGFVADEELNALYQAHDLFILPTLYEGMPTVVLEAMSRGLPVLVTDVGATRELVDEANGRIIPIKDPRATADALLGMAALPPAQRLAMGKASYERVLARFTWEAVAAQHEALFRRISATLSTPAP